MAATPGTARRPTGGSSLADGDDRLPSTTDTDWVTYADHVVVGAATAEQRLPAASIEVERGEGLIGRTVTLEVRQVAWSRDDAAQPAPKGWQYNAAGFVFDPRRGPRRRGRGGTVRRSRGGDDGRQRR
ncbi:hypothetical protein [Nonomuraea zeae]|uniref:Uncharacterized protein n=1 Tax=Nonomuraea zeae TaxID=1642303 RepID=A0A5S4GFT3_9ACTN|nr:hypothetical protein [Nonomuraea zeae]TMR31729.1 hypothetical protein ETD85_24850 [Nonomuraea zeae]